MPLRKIHYISIVFIFLLILSASCSKIGNKSKPKVGYYAPDFSLESIDGEMYKLSDFSGKVVFINFWATWCPPCKDEIPSMIKLYNKLGNKGLVILAISVDTDSAALKKFIKKYDIPFLVLRDTEKNAYNLYKATGVPETHLISKSGIIKKQWIGPFNWTRGDLVKEVKRLMAE